MHTELSLYYDQEFVELRELYEEATQEDVHSPSVQDRLRRMTTPENKRITAYHEAGHAIMCSVEGVAVTKITIEIRHFAAPPWFWFGCCTSDPTPDFDPDTVIKKRVRISMAGEIAERILQGGPLEMMFDYCEDLEGIERGSVLPEWSNAWKTQQWAKVRDDLREHWPLVVLLAEALLERETLTGDEVARIFREAACLEVSGKRDP